jgi:hypothetical protein
MTLPKIETEAPWPRKPKAKEQRWKRREAAKPNRYAKMDEDVKKSKKILRS